MMYVEELIGPDTVNTMPPETITAFQDHGEVRGDTVLEGVDEAERAARAAARRGRRLRRRRRHARGRGRAEVRQLVRRAARRHQGQAGELARLDETRDATSSSGSGRATRRSGRGATRRAGSAGSTSPWRMREDVDLFLTARRRGVRRSIDDVVLLGMGGSSLAPEVMRRTFGSRALPRARHDAPAGDPRPRSRSSTSRGRCSSPRRSRAATLETRSHTDYFWELAPRGEQWVGDHRPGLRAREAGARARVPRRSSPASRRSAGATRRCRRSGWCRRR